MTGLPSRNNAGPLNGGLTKPWCVQHRRPAPQNRAGQSRKIGSRQFDDAPTIAGRNGVPCGGFGSMLDSGRCSPSILRHPPHPGTGRLGATAKCGHSACPERWRSVWSQQAANPESDMMQPASDGTGVRITPFRVKKICRPTTNRYGSIRYVLRNRLMTGRGECQSGGQATVVPRRTRRPCSRRSRIAP